MKFNSDIDIDFADRTQILAKIKHVPASIIKNDQVSKHNTGIHITEIPVDPFTAQCSIDYEQAEKRGYIKLDFLNVSLYSKIKDEQQLVQLMNQKPPWQLLQTREFCQQLIHIGNHYDTLIRMPEPITSIIEMAMFLSVIRPAKRHLIGKRWIEISETVWEKPRDDSYYFKKSHAVAYANLVIVHMNLLNNSSD